MSEIYETKIRYAFDLDIIGRYYEKRELLTLQEVEKLLVDTTRIRELFIDGLDWLLFDQLISFFKSIDLVDHYQALSAGLKKPFTGIEDFYKECIKQKLLSPTTLNRTYSYIIPEQSLPIGTLMLELGFIDQVALQRALGIKEIIRNDIGINVAIGQVFRSLANLSVIDFFQALGIQVGIPFESLDKSAPAIFAAAVARQGHSK